MLLLISLDFRDFVSEFFLLIGSLPQVTLPTISSRVLQLLLKYLYTGECLFPRDDLNLGIELVAAADQFLLEPMKIQCERALSEKIDAEVSE
jgi:hypothetical protein